jgi:hypothetical protein
MAWMAAVPSFLPQVSRVGGGGEIFRHWHTSGRVASTKTSASWLTIATLADSLPPARKHLRETVARLAKQTTRPTLRLPIDQRLAVLCPILRGKCGTFVRTNVPFWEDLIGDDGA